MRFVVDAMQFSGNGNLIKGAYKGDWEPGLANFLVIDKLLVVVLPCSYIEYTWHDTASLFTIIYSILDPDFQ